MNHTVGRAGALVYVCFFVSGAAALVYEIVWARYLALSLGHTSYAVVAVLAAFMGGMAVGNAWMGVKAGRMRRPLAWYGWLEVAIGLYALLFPSYYAVSHQGFLALARGSEPGDAGLLGLKFAFSLLLLLPPAALIGATMPVLAQYVTRSLGELRQKIAALYGVNCAGAVAGCVVADFWWLPVFGLPASVYLGAGLNLGAGAIALWLSGRRGEGPGGWTAGAGAKAVRGETYTAGERKLALAAIGVSGFVAMLYEVAWTRMLGLVLGASTHAFSLMLITFISGLAAGAWLLWRWQGLRDTLRALGWTELALALTLTVCLGLYEWLPYWFARVARLLPRTATAYPLYQLCQGLMCVGVLFLPALWLGMTVPLASRVATVEVAGAGRAVGWVFAVNTIGTVVGAALTGLWLVPQFGLARTFGVGLTLSALLGLVILTRRRWLARPLWLALCPLVIVGGAVLAGRCYADAWRRAFTLSLWRAPNAPANRGQFRAGLRENDLRFYRDGASATVSVNAFREKGVAHLNLKVNNKSDASTAEDSSTQLLLGHLPMLLRPEAEEVLVIGLGSGMTCGAVGRYSGIRRIDTVEISSEVIPAARLFDAYTGRILEDPRLRVMVEDAKTYLQLCARPYDVIISEPSNPWMAGVAGVFSREFFASCRDRLGPGGLMVQWVHVYESSDLALDLVLNTFGSVFPFMGLWQSSALDLLLVGAAEPRPLNWAALERRFNEPAVRLDLERIHLGRLPVFLACEVVSPGNARFVASPAAGGHSDLRPVLEYEAQRAAFVRQEARLWQAVDERLHPRPATLLGDYLRAKGLGPDDIEALARSRRDQKFPPLPLVRSALLRWQKEQPDHPAPAEWLRRFGNRSVSYLAALQQTTPARETLIRQAEQEPEPLRRHTDRLLEAYRADRSAFYIPDSGALRAALGRLAQTDRANEGRYQMQLAELAWDQGDDAACVQVGTAAFGPDPASLRRAFAADPTGTLYVLARLVDLYLRQSRLPEARALCQAITNAGLGQRATESQARLLEMICRKGQGARGQG